MSLSDRLDQFLEQHALAPDETPIRRDPTRPKAPGVNAIRCASCGQMEYLTRDHCRCGHFLRGQLEDEFLACADRIADRHDELLRSLMPKLKKLRYLNLLGLPFVVAPFIKLAFIAEGVSMGALLLIALGFALLGLVAFVERRMLRPAAESQISLENFSFEEFLEQRSVNSKESGLPIWEVTP
ncbi:hypothetical protein V8J82_21225 [Gymnodinialimonas sp. 2305UL16-5]